MFETRPATENDYEFLYQLHKAALGPYVASTWGWDEALQRRMFRERFRPEKNAIIMVDGEPAGCFRLQRHEGYDSLDYVALLPAFQRRGIGTALIRKVKASAAARGVPVRLSVLKANPARELYERLGFEVTGWDAVRWYMECKTDSFVRACSDAGRSPAPRPRRRAR